MLTPHECHDFFVFCNKAAEPKSKTRKENLAKDKDLSLYCFNRVHCYTSNILYYLKFKTDAAWGKKKVFVVILKCGTTASRSM